MPRTVHVGFHAIYRLLANPSGLPDEKAVIQCQLLNESLGGLALNVVAQRTRLQIGNLVYVMRAQEGEAGDLCLVRWFRFGHDGTLTFGIKFLRGELQAVLAELADGTVYPALLAASEDAQGSTQRMLAAPGLHVVFLPS